MKKITLSLLFLGVFSFQKTNELIQVLQDYTALHQQYNEAYSEGDTDKQKVIGKKCNQFHEEKFLTRLSDIEAEFCASNNQLLLNAYVNMLSVTKSSASEAPKWTFAKMYVCHPSSVLETIDNSKEKKGLLRNLGFGFENIANTIEKGKRAELRGRIDKLHD